MLRELKDFVPFVKSQMEFHQRQADRYRSDKRRHELHSGTAEKFSQLIDLIESGGGCSPARTASGSGTTLGWSELQSLPEELVKELSITESDKLDYSIAEIIAQQGGVASLDRILVELYRLSGEILKRQNLNARIYRMVQKGMIYSVPGKKGVYSSEEIPEDEELALNDSADRQ